MLIINGDATQIPLADNSIDTCITDPPYGLGFMGKEWDTFDKSQFGIAGNEGENDLKVKKSFKALPRYNNGGDLYNFTLLWATEVYRVLKPGALLLSFGGTRTYHRMVCAIEDAGFEIRDMVEWVYGSGFPKSYDISKGIDKQAGAEREVVGIRKEYAARACKNNFEQFTAINPSERGINSKEFQSHMGEITAPSTPEAQLWDGWGTALKPAHEPIVVAMKPVDGTFVNNALTWGVAGLWIDGGRVEWASKADLESQERAFSPNSTAHTGGHNPKTGTANFACSSTGSANPTNPQGRFPANFIHDGSDEVKELFPQTGKSGVAVRHNSGGNTFGGDNPKPPMDDMGYGDSGSAARFFYCAKASRSERNAGLEGTNHHPTIKPIELMRYLVRLTKTPTGGVVLDPFTGSGTTGIACELEGREFIGIEKEAEYVEIAKKRIAYWQDKANEKNDSELQKE